MENTTGRNIADAFTKLMESMEKTRTTARLEMCMHEYIHFWHDEHNYMATLQLERFRKVKIGCKCAAITEKKLILSVCLTGSQKEMKR